MGESCIELSRSPGDCASSAVLVGCVSHWHAGAAPAEELHFWALFTLACASPQSSLDCHSYPRKATTTCVLAVHDVCSSSACFAADFCNSTAFIYDPRLALHRGFGCVLSIPVPSPLPDFKRYARGLNGGTTCRSLEADSIYGVKIAPNCGILEHDTLL